MTRQVEAHLAAVGAVDIDRLRALYAPDARLYDSVGTDAVVGRAAVAAHFTRWLSAPRHISCVQVVVTGHDNSLVAVSFTATPDGGSPVDIVDVMRFDENLLITEMTAFAVKRPSR